MTYFFGNRFGRDWHCDREEDEDRDEGRDWGGLRDSDFNLGWIKYLLKDFGHGGWGGNECRPEPSECRNDFLSNSLQQLNFDNCEPTTWDDDRFDPEDCHPFKFPGYMDCGQKMRELPRFEVDTLNIDEWSGPLQQGCFNPCYDLPE